MRWTHFLLRFRSLSFARLRAGPSEGTRAGARNPSPRSTRPSISFLPWKACVVLSTFVIIANRLRSFFEWCWTTTSACKKPGAAPLQLSRRMLVLSWPLTWSQFSGILLWHLKSINTRICSSSMTLLAHLLTPLGGLFRTHSTLRFLCLP